MAHIVVDEQQAEIIRRRDETVEIRDRDGTSLGFVARQVTAEEIEEAKRVADTDLPGRTTAEVLARLNSLGNR